MVLRLTWSNRALRDSDRLDPKARTRIVAALERYSETRFAWDQAAGVITVLHVFRRSQGYDGAERMFTDDLLVRLCERDDRPWREWRHGSRLTAIQLAKLLKPYDVRRQKALPARRREGRGGTRRARLPAHLGALGALAAAGESSTWKLTVSV